MSSPEDDYEVELQTALRAVHRASVVTKNVMKGIESLDKQDASPVTMADFAAQALIIAAVHAAFPEDRFIAEEAADMLRTNGPLRAAVWELVHGANVVVGGAGVSDHLASPVSEGEMMDLIDRGSKGIPPAEGRVWILDPVDGTATFLKGQQYAVCLALTVDGKQKVGVVGCPNLRPGERRVEEDLVDGEGYGVVLSAVVGRGASIAPMTRARVGSHESVKRVLESTDLSALRFTDSVRSSHAHRPSHDKTFQKLGLTKENNNVWSMQVKYVALALSACDAMIRIPQNRSIRASVWDHAGGQLIFTEAGGMITDLDGRQFDFAKGREFGENWGFVAADKAVYFSVFGVVQEVLAEDKPR